MPVDSDTFYQLEKVQRLGKGNFGSVYLVTHTTAEGCQHYALKHIELTGQGSTFRTAARTEGAVHAAVTGHPLIVAHHGCLHTDRRVSLLLEYCNGGTLTERRGKDNTLWPEDKVLCYFLQLCLALKHCHDRGVVHRDVKPENVFVINSTESGGMEELRLGDFGLSCFINNRGTYENTPAGTPVCKSPEMTMGLPYTLATDIWSLGVVLYWLMSGGRFPFHGYNQEELKRDILCHEPTALNSQYAKDLRDLCSQMLNKKANSRPTIAKVLQHQSLVKAQPSLQAIGLAVTAEFNCIRMPPPSPANMSESVYDDSSSDGDESVMPASESDRRVLEDALAARLAYFLEQSQEMAALLCTCGAASVDESGTPPTAGAAAAVTDEQKAKCPRCSKVPARHEQHQPEHPGMLIVSVAERAVAATGAMDDPLTPNTPVNHLESPATPLFASSPFLAFVERELGVTGSGAYPASAPATPAASMPTLPALPADDSDAVDEDDWVMVASFKRPTPRPAAMAKEAAHVSGPAAAPTPGPAPAQTSVAMRVPNAVPVTQQAHPFRHQRSHRHKHRPQVSVPGVASAPAHTTVAPAPAPSASAPAPVPAPVAAQAAPASAPVRALAPVQAPAPVHAAAPVSAQQAPVTMPSPAAAPSQAAAPAPAQAHTTTTTTTTTTVTAGSVSSAAVPLRNPTPLRVPIPVSSGSNQPSPATPKSPQRPLKSIMKNSSSGNVVVVTTVPAPSAPPVVHTAPAPAPAPAPVPAPAPAPVMVIPAPAPAPTPAVPEMTEEEEVAAAAAQQAKFDVIARDIAVLRTQIVKKVTPTEDQWERQRVQSLHSTSRVEEEEWVVTEQETMQDKVANLRERMGQTTWVTQGTPRRAKREWVRRPRRTQTMKDSLHRARLNGEDSEEVFYEEIEVSQPRTRSSAKGYSTRERPMTGRTLHEYVANHKGSEFTGTTYTIRPSTTTTTTRTIYSSQWNMPELSTHWAMPTLTGI